MDAGHVLPGIAAIQDEMIALRHSIHAHPELGFEEVVTSGLPYASRIDGVMHACGHDGHTATLLAAARHLAHTRTFNGTLQVIFQPAEEGLGGARKMLEEGLLERFPCDAIFSMHNVPGYPVGHLGFYSGPFMASADTVTITIIGSGGHGAVPHKAVDPVVVCSSIVMALQSIVSRNVNPQEMAIITVGSLHAGSASNVIPSNARMSLSVRALTPEIRHMTVLENLIECPMSVLGLARKEALDPEWVGEVLKVMQQLLAGSLK